MLQLSEALLRCTDVGLAGAATGDAGAGIDGATSSPANTSRSSAASLAVCPETMLRRCGVAGGRSFSANDLRVFACVALEQRTGEGAACVALEQRTGEGAASSESLCGGDGSEWTETTEALSEERLRLCDFLV